MVYVNPKRLKTNQQNDMNILSEQEHIINKTVLLPNSVYINPAFRTCSALPPKGFKHNHHFPAENVSCKNNNIVEPTRSNSQTNYSVVKPCAQQLHVSKNKSRPTIFVNPNSAHLKKANKEAPPMKKGWDKHSNPSNLIFINPNFDNRGQDLSNSKFDEDGSQNNTSSDAIYSLNTKQFQMKQRTTNQTGNNIPVAVSPKGAALTINKSTLNHQSNSNLVAITTTQLIGKRKLESCGQELPSIRSKCISSVFVNPNSAHFKNSNITAPVMEKASNNNFNLSNLTFSKSNFDNRVQHLSTSTFDENNLQNNTGSVAIYSDSPKPLVPPKRLAFPINQLKLNNRRSSSCNSNLVPINTTKLLCKRKQSCSVESDVSSTSNKPVFSLKTKLVHVSQENNTGNRLPERSKVKQAVTKTKLQVLTHNVIRKQSSKNSQLTLVDDVPTSSSDTIIQSKNGKSLSLVRKCVNPNKCQTNPTNLQVFTPKILRKQNPINSKVMLVDGTPYYSSVTTINSKGGQYLSLGKKCINFNKCQTKPTNLKVLTPNVARKQNLTNSKDTLVGSVSNTSSVTTMKSKNGRSLTLVREYVDSNSCQTKNIRCLNRNENQRRYIKHSQLWKDLSQSYVHRLRRAQLSKLNAQLIKGKSSGAIDQSKYVFKKKGVVLRQMQTNIKINKKKTAFKSKEFKNIVEKNKYDSKYRLVRQQAGKSLNKSETVKKLDKRIVQNAVICSRSKINWKAQRSTPTASCIRKGLSIVNIGGTFYRCSRTSLTRNKARVMKVLQNPVKDLLLHVHGQKFQLENNGQCLRRLDKRPGRQRVDIGGVTFVSSSSGSSLTRTNYHTARSIILQAKQKSITQLTRMCKKNNEPCPFFHRLGRCTGNDRGTCTRQHDPKYIAVCKKYIKGLCKEPHCLLSHMFSSHNMPTCQHFLAGHCGRDHCPYPHVKVSDNAPICQDFLRGFCLLGDQCAKRHIEICPSYEKNLCPRGKYCPYPHPPQTKSGQSLKGKFKLLERKSQPGRVQELVSTSSLRYFEDLNLQSEIKIELEKTEQREDEEYNTQSKRPKLGRLPSFIPLSPDEKCKERN